MRVTIYGASGNMGIPALKEILPLDFVDKVTVLYHSDKCKKRIHKKIKKYKDKLIYIKGSVASKDVIKKTLEGSNIVINLAAVIPPLSDKKPTQAIEANQLGPQVICEAISEIKENQPKLIHISTMAIYGNRDYKHIYGEVGDPLLPSPFDIYAITKMRGELEVLESDVENYAILRQTAILYDELMMKNISDGLMFHTCFNAPLEWVTAEDSAILLRNILIKEHKKELNQSNFWKKVFNIGGPKENRLTGYETLSKGFGIIGASTKQFFKPNYNATKNFHGEFFADNYRLEELFHYEKTTVDDFWHHVLKKNWYFVFGRIVPKVLLRKMIIDPLLKDSNAPYYWYKHNDEAKLIAYFGSKENFENIPKKWDDVSLLINNKNPDNGEEISYKDIANTIIKIDKGFDSSKKDEDIDIDDLKSVALSHGGKLITSTFNKGDIFTKVEWEDQDGNRFFARPNTILRAGHWNNPSYKSLVWDFDRLAKKDKIYASVWYDTHAKDENNLYYFDEDYKAHYKKI